MAHIYSCAKGIGLRNRPFLCLGKGSDPIYIGHYGLYGVAMCPPSTLFYNSRVFPSILSYKYFCYVHARLPVHLQWEKLGKLVENNRDQQINRGAVKTEALRVDQPNCGAIHLDQPAPRLGVGDRHGLVQFSGGTRHRGNQKVHHSWLRSGCGT